MALIHPAKIEEFPQQAHGIDSETELKVQDAINQFFEQNKVIPSPWENIKPVPLEINTPTRPNDSLNSTKDSIRSKKEGKSTIII